MIHMKRWKGCISFVYSVQEVVLLPEFLIMCGAFDIVGNSLLYFLLKVGNVKILPCLEASTCN